MGYTVAANQQQEKMNSALGLVTCKPLAQITIAEDLSGFFQMVEVSPQQLLGSKEKPANN